jgi:hypothetical protein
MVVSDGLQWMIAERRLTLTTEAGEIREVVVRIGKPKQSPDRDDFSCDFQIVGCGEGKVRCIYGLDAFQSLQLTLKFLSIMLNNYRQEVNGRMYWQEPGDDMGFANVKQPTE